MEDREAHPSVCARGVEMGLNSEITCLPACIVLQDRRSKEVLQSRVVKVGHTPRITRAQGSGDVASNSVE